MAPPGRLVGGVIRGGAGAAAFDVRIVPTPILVARDLEKYGNGIRSFSEPLKEAIKVMGQSFQKNFDVGGRPPWPELAPYTRAVKQHLGQDNGILIRTGNLRTVVGQQNIWKIEGGHGSKEGRAYVYDLPGARYGSTHQHGERMQAFSRLDPFAQELIHRRGLMGRGDIPARPFLQFHPEDRAKVEKIFEDWHDRRAKRFMRLKGGI